MNTLTSWNLNQEFNQISSTRSHLKKKTVFREPQTEKIARALPV